MLKGTKGRISVDRRCISKNNSQMLVKMEFIYLLKLKRR
jgi:hypothetical protein